MLTHQEESGSQGSPSGKYFKFRNQKEIFKGPQSITNLFKYIYSRLAISKSRSTSRSTKLAIGRKNKKYVKLLIAGQTRQEEIFICLTNKVEFKFCLIAQDQRSFSLHRLEQQKECMSTIWHTVSSGWKQSIIKERTG